MRAGEAWSGGYGRAIADAQAVLEVNQRYYQAFETADLDALAEIWERSSRATCTHPGWSTLRGWGRVAASYYAIFQNTQALQFVLTEEQVEVVGDAAWVSLDENLLGDQGGSTVAALNVFVRDPVGDRWRMVCHHGSIVASRFDLDPTPGP